MEVGMEVLFLDENNERYGIIKSIKGDRVQIAGLNNALYLTDIECILYPIYKFSV